MKNKINLVVGSFYFVLLIYIVISCKPAEKIGSSVTSSEKFVLNETAPGDIFTFTIKSGEYHNHPTFAIWLEDREGTFIQTLFVTRYIARGVFAYSSDNDSIWKKELGEVQRPASLPYWLHKRGGGKILLPTPKNPVPDVYSGATPVADFVLQTRSDKSLPDKFTVLLEVNQPWDWNENWTNTKYQDNTNYKSSCQPSVIYAVDVDKEVKFEEYSLNPIGHGHYAGEDGLLYSDLSTLTTALEIFKSIKVTIK